MRKKHLKKKIRVGIVIPLIGKQRNQLVHLKIMLFIGNLLSIPTDTMRTIWASSVDFFG